MTKSIRSILLLLAMIILIGACASSRHTPNKKLKPGKPIPCPLKDC